MGMLESRNTYGYFGISGGYTGEGLPKDVHTVRMAYRDYKSRWADHKTVHGSYCREDKTIEVIFTAEEMSAKTNLGNRYQMGSYYFRFGGVEKWIEPISEFKAKNFENAERNAKKFAKQFGYTFEGVATHEEYCKAHRW